MHMSHVMSYEPWKAATAAQASDQSPALVLLLAKAGVMGGWESGEVRRLLGGRLLLEVAVAQGRPGAQALGGVIRQQLVQQGHGAH